jgi:thiosulfate/3-mercaptopyruvate sulfurtransferase
VRYSFTAAAGNQQHKLSRTNRPTPSIVMKRALTLSIITLTLASAHAPLASAQNTTRAGGASAQSAVPVLVSTAWLSDHLRDDKLVILHVGNEGSFTPGHIPGARLMTLASFAPARDGRSTEMPDSATLGELLRNAGISSDSRIIVYAATNPPTLAARLYVTLDQFGLGAQTSMLDGGLRAWRAENRALSTEATPATRGTVALRPRADLLADHLYVSSFLGKTTSAIVDARDTGFWTGAQQNTNTAPRAGRIPGARNVVYSSLVAETGLMHSRDSLTAIFTAAGVTPGQPVIAYCHVGQQASLVFLAARLAGHEVRLYDGSYEDWSKRTDLPIETGPPR